MRDATASVALARRYFWAVDFVGVTNYPDYPPPRRSERRSTRGRDRDAATGSLLPPRDLAGRLPDSVVRDHLIRVAERTDASFEEVARETGTSGYTPETVAIAVVLAARIIECGLETAAYELNAVGGDTDTVASIAGQIAGAALGSGNLPIRVLGSVPDSAGVLRIAEEFAATAA